MGSIPVGLDPVTVRARSNTEAWVVNGISDTISIVDLMSMNVVATLYPGNEPADVVFAGKPNRAFVSVSQLTPFPFARQTVLVQVRVAPQFPVRSLSQFPHFHFVFVAELGTQRKTESNTPTTRVFFMKGLLNCGEAG